MINLLYTSLCSVCTYMRTLPPIPYLTCFVYSVRFIKKLKILKKICPHHDCVKTEGAPCLSSTRFCSIHEKLRFDLKTRWLKFPINLLYYSHMYPWIIIYLYLRIPVNFVFTSNLFSSLFLFVELFLIVKLITIFIVSNLDSLGLSQIVLFLI